MKSIKEKAKAYDNIIEKANKMNSENCEACQICIEELIPELRESEDEKIRMSLIELFKDMEWDDSILHDYNMDKGKTIAWLEKQGEQNSADKVEPKFKVGDWIISHYNNVAYIKSIDEKNYFLSCNDGNTVRLDIDYINRDWRLWTIQDAKDGDVLFIGIDSSTCIFKKLEGNLLYSYIISDGKLLVEDSHYYYETCDNVHPATKEQRDLLFQKMKKAGYEWDSEKKELKKIENEIEIPFGAKDSELQEATYYIPKGFHAEIGGDKVIIKKDKQKTTWSEEDEELRALTIENLSELKQRYGEDYGKVGKCIDWLKSLKDRHTWKPSDEQMDALDDVISSRDIKYDVLSELWKDLKQL